MDSTNAAYESQGRSSALNLQGGIDRKLAASRHLDSSCEPPAQDFFKPTYWQIGLEFWTDDIIYRHPICHKGSNTQDDREQGIQPKAKERQIRVAGINVTGLEEVKLYCL